MSSFEWCDISQDDIFTNFLNNILLDFLINNFKKALFTNSIFFLKTLRNLHYLKPNVFKMKLTIQEIIASSISTKQQILGNETLINTVEEIVLATVKAYQADKRVYFCGNGGSAADAQHLAAEFSGRFYINRKPLYAEALHVNTSYITAVANDFSYNDIYSRMMEAAGRKGDIFFAISTSGNSENVIKAIEVAKNQGVICIGMTGETGGKMKDICDFLLNVPSKETPRIQESHILLGHIICELVEKKLFS